MSALERTLQQRLVSYRIVSNSERTERQTDRQTDGLEVLLVEHVEGVLLRRGHGAEARHHVVGARFAAVRQSGVVLGEAGAR